MKVGLSISFEEGAVNGSFFIDLFNKYVRFTPKAYTKKYSTKTWDEKKHLKEIASATTKDTISIFDLEGNILRSGLTGSDIPHRSVTIEQDEDFFMPLDYEIVQMIRPIKGFTAGYLYNQEYAYIQSTESETLLEEKHFPKEILDSIKNTPFHLSVFDKKDYDTKFNPGRMILIGNTWLMASWKMWFGKPFFKLVPKDRLLSFPHAIEVKELDNEIIYVQLYEKINEPTTPDSVFRQWKWQEWLNFDDLIERYP